MSQRKHESADVSEMETMEELLESAVVEDTKSASLSMESAQKLSTVAGLIREKYLVSKPSVKLGADAVFKAIGTKWNTSNIQWNLNFLLCDGANQLVVGSRDHYKYIAFRKATEGDIKAWDTRRTQHNRQTLAEVLKSGE